MATWIKQLTFCTVLLPAVCCTPNALSAAEPASAAEKKTVRDLNTPREFPSIASRDAWQARAKDIRQQILVSAGLWPMPEKTPLHSHIFGKIARDGYTVEKAYFQTYPGFYLAGNLYRPLRKGPGPFPGILNPHGHWKEGRMADTKDGSIAARCISFARQGMIAFSYDMVGFNDTHFVGTTTNQPYYNTHREFGTNKTDLLWSISLMGLQTWNSIRALDFLESLPDVDRRRLACTGESGGATQTFMLGAVEDRLAAQAPVVMVSHTMQGGCSCENMPGLRVEYSNMEIAAAATPRPQILVSATGDWTKDTPTVEGPAIGHIYELLNAPDSLRYVRFDFGHNYNQTSREAVYEWFGKWLLKASDLASLKEAPYQKEPDADLRVFPDGQLPKDAMTREQFTESLKMLHRKQLQTLMPHTKTGLEKFQELMLPAWRHTLQMDWPRSVTHTVSEPLQGSGAFTAAALRISRKDEEQSIQATYWAPSNLHKQPAPKVVVLCDPIAPDENRTAPSGLASRLLQRGFAVLAINSFTGSEPPDQFANFYTTYNRTKLQQRVRDLLTVCAAARGPDPVVGNSRFSRVILCGRDRAGLWALLAAPAADAVIADCDTLDPSNDEALLTTDLLCPGLRNLGSFEGVAMLAAPHPLLLHNTGANFPTQALRSAYKAAGAKSTLRVESRPLLDEDLVNWVSKQK